MATDNYLAGNDKPKFFPVAAPGEIGFRAPEIRLGDAVRLAVRSLTVMQKEALVLGARSGQAWRLVSDEGAYLNGHDEAPPPLAFLSTGMVSAYMTEITALAKARGIGLRDIRLTLDNFYTMQGSALKGTMIGGADSPVLVAAIDADADRETLTALLYDATAASPLNGLMRHCHDGLFTLVHNGHEIAPSKVKPLGAPAMADPNAQFDTVVPAPGDWQDLLRKGEMTPRTAETTSAAGSSLAEQQDRRLHIRVVCTRRADGVKQIHQSMFNPQGTQFYFLSDEAPENGGKGLAPDAAGYISAGIGFCFMTQLGRYAKIVKSDLRAYRIIQDTHFSLGGASAGTGKVGEALAPETHVYIDSGEDDDFARTLLAMGEQTCFLHAFCRTALKTKIKLAD
ncbi:MAG: hypothetical protein Tsb0016_07670 [Sphingomonadales bacterium]